MLRLQESRVRGYTAGPDDSSSTQQYEYVLKPFDHLYHVLGASAMIFGPGVGQCRIYGLFLGTVVARPWVDSEAFERHIQS